MHVRRLVSVLAVVILTTWLGGFGGLSATARASTTQFTLLQDDPAVLKNPVATLEQAHDLGITVLRFDIPWQAVAPDNESWTRPNFNAANPGAYNETAWASYDRVITTAQSLGITVDLDLAPGAPRWATGKVQPHDGGYPHWQWEPDTSQFGLFAQAAGERYSGNWNPQTRRLDPGNPADLPRVTFWSVWNEPNYGPSLAPQALPGHPGVESSPRVYRQLVDQEWSGLRRAGHRLPGETFLFGELAPRSQGTRPGRFTDFNGMTPMVFLKNLYCLNASYKPLRGSAATLRGCPATAAGSRHFIADNPALFKASGVSDHPYDEWFPPNEELDIPKLQGWAQENTQDTSLATIGVLARGLDHLTAAYGDDVQLPIYDTEYGYQTSPPKTITPEKHWPDAATAGYYDNWGEYLHYKNPRIRSFAQYLLQDSTQASKTNGDGFPSGLMNFNGTKKADYSAFRMPIYLPNPSPTSAYQSVEVWGAARPAVYAATGPYVATRTVTLLFKPLGATSFSTLTTLALNPEGYYDAQIRFPASGTLMARWDVPALSGFGPLTGTEMDSRPVTITVS